MRAFIAIDLPIRVKTQLGRIAQELRQSDCRASWVKPDNLHITMKFLGDTDDNLLQQVSEQLDRLGQEQGPFAVTLGGLGFLPPQGRPRVLCVATGSQDRLAHLAHQLEQRLTPLGLQPERRFAAHVTLARIKGDKNLAKLRQLASRVSLRQTFSVASLNLYSSHLHPDGARYQLLHRGRFRLVAPR
ncbi:MAG: RNA 2',3'-cyclic phosphodiesterase [Pelovirga sp.]